MQDRQWNELVPGRGSEAVWERLQGETSRAFEAFVAYRDMGATRSTANVAQRLGKSKALMDRWCSRWQWVERVRQYELELDRERQEMLRTQREEMVARHANYGRWMQGKAAALIAQLQGEELSVEQARRYMELGLRVERDALGMPAPHPTGQGRQDVSLFDDLGDEELDLLIANLQMALGKE